MVLEEETVVFLVSMATVRGCVRCRKRLCIVGMLLIKTKQILSPSKTITEARTQVLNSGHLAETATTAMINKLSRLLIVILITT